jgi:hypothetical protein
MPKRKLLLYGTFKNVDQVYHSKQEKKKENPKFFITILSSVCHGFYFDLVEKRHPPGDINSDRMTLPALSHSLLT